jgi:glucose/arabinose dehydrogenase
MTRNECHVIAKWKKLVTDRMQQLGMIAPGKIRSPDGSGKENIPDKGNAIGLMNEHHMSWRMSRTVDDLHHLLTDSHRIAIKQPTVGLECIGTTHPEHHALLAQLTDPEVIIGMRSFNRNTKPLGKQTSLTAMVDVTMGDEDLLHVITALASDGQKMIHIPAGIDECCLASFRATHQGTVLLERRDRHNLKDHRDGLSQMLNPRRFLQQAQELAIRPGLRAWMLTLALLHPWHIQAVAAATGPDTVRTELHNIRVVKLVDGFEHPWSIAWLPDGRMLITERAGRLRLIGSDMRLDPRPIDGLPPIMARGQGGLFDVAVHPRFADNRFIYLAYNATGPGGFGTALMRARLDGHQLIQATVLFSMEPKSTSGQHFGGRIVLDGKGHVFLTLGDRGDKDRAQRPMDHAGAVIRLFDDGRIPPDNPFRSSTYGREEKFSYGHRNIQGAAIHPVSKELWVHEHGPQGGDEVNIIRPGRNYGWPVITHGVNYITGTRIGEGTQRPDMVSPIHQWTPSIAVSGMSFYNGNAFPKWQGHLLVGALRGTMLVRLAFDGERLVREERMLTGRIGRIRDVRTGPDGLVYLLSDAGNGALYRLEPAD